MLTQRSHTLAAQPAAALIEETEFYRLDATRLLDPGQRGQLGQFLTPPNVAKFLAGLSAPSAENVRFLDPGAGVGSLTAAWLEEILSRNSRPRSIHATLCEIDSNLVPYLTQTVSACAAACADYDVEFDADIVHGDFVERACEWLMPKTLLGGEGRLFDSVVLNPPYRKINSDSAARQQLRSVGIETSNLYTGFLWLVVKLLAPRGEFIAITPRSFCNGTYFRPFRVDLLRQTTISHIHAFESRKTAFRDDDVLQENIIWRAVKTPADIAPTTISTSSGPDNVDLIERTISSADLVHPDDADQVIHIVPDELQGAVARRIRSFTSTLEAIGIQVSTGRVVDFRAKEYLVPSADAALPGTSLVPLIYPTHFDAGAISWPKNGKKPNCLAVSEATEGLLVPTGTYVLVKRFTAKEESRRVSAAVCRPKALPKGPIGFENHLNYFHNRGTGLPVTLANGLAAYLNSSLVDSYFRQFSGHTQVNASDLKTLPYPDRETLEKLGENIGSAVTDRETIDRLIAEELQHVARDDADPVQARKRIDEALSILKLLGLPRAQQNDRSALTLLALLDIKPSTKWSDGASPLMGITPIMDFAKDHYGTTYAPNTRETFRRQTMHQFLEAAIAIYNPDAPSRPVNSPKAVYQIAPLLLDTLRTFGTKRWAKAIGEWLATVDTLKTRYARDRDMARIPLKLPTGQRIELSPGGQNVLVEKIIHEFCPRFTPGGVPIYIGDTEQKHAHFDKAALLALGVAMDSHGKMPDVVIHHVEKNWLILIEAVTSHGPVDGKRRDELKRLFAHSSAPLVFVTAFMDRAAMVRFLGDISWETEVWVADAPSHMIHFNGERFLGPYDT
ncbi:MAG: BsuBI/PstI family type II restriction endonuclease [Pirellulales bacterium]